jgi:hypothetical protein
MGGRFVRAGETVLHRVARWTGAALEPLGTGVGGGWGSTAVSDLVSFDDGAGPGLYAGGDFQVAGGIDAKGIARWNGASWTEVGGGLDAPVRALATWDDGQGSSLYVGGSFGHAGGVPMKGIARWDGTAWHGVGGGVDGGPILDLHVFDDGGGPALYAAGEFLIAGGMPASRIARWDGISWTALGSGLTDSAHAMATLDFGFGPNLFVGGDFTHAGSKFVGKVARWNGLYWSGTWPPAEWVNDLTVFDDGSGPRLFAGGQSLWGELGEGKIGLLRWEQTGWSTYEQCIISRVQCLVGFDDGSGEKLFVGGEFTANAAGDGHLSRWGCQDPDVGRNYCSSGTTTNGCVPVVHASGLPSASNDAGFPVDVAQVEGEQLGVLLYSVTGPASLPWVAGSTSLLCLAPPLQRMTVQPTTGIVGSCAGSIVEDWSAFIALHPSALGNPFEGGETVWIQGWFRDPPAPGGSNLSDGLLFVVSP